MKSSPLLRQAAQAAQAHQRTPMIKFLGKRTTPSMLQAALQQYPNLTKFLESVDHSPHAHPASPNDSLPDSFATYRSKAQQHGPLGHRTNSSSTSSSSQQQAYGAIGGHSGQELGSVEPKKGEYFDRSELPERFRRTPWSQAEIEAVDTGGASMAG
ncbi:MAG: hypothetical protein Q9227_006597 [Pyrenula ochraceoflavens]